MADQAPSFPFKFDLPPDAEFYIQEARLPRNVGLLRQLGASWMRGSSVAGVLSFLEDSGQTFAREEGFDPLPLLSGEELEKPEVARVLAQARSRDELDYLRKRRAELNDLEQVIAAGPLHPMVSAFLSGIPDPINLIPLGWAARIGMAVRGATLARGVAGGASIGLVGAVMMEPFQQAIDPFRDLGDTLTDLSFGTLLGAGLGAAGVGIGAAAAAWRRRRSGLLLPSERTPDVDLVVRAMVNEGIPQDMAANASHEMRAAMTKALRETMAQPEPAGGSTTGAKQVVDNYKITRDVLRDALLEPELGPLGRALVKAATRQAVFRYPGLELATSPFKAAREFVYSYGDPGALTAALARQLSDEDLKVAYAEAKRRGFELSEEDFIAIARDEMAAGLAVTEKGTFEARRALLMSRFHEFTDRFQKIATEAVQAGLVRTREEFDQLAATWARYRQEPHRFPTPPVQNAALEKLLNAAYDEWQNRIAKPFLERIRRSGLWESYGGNSRSNPFRDLDAEYFPKQLDVHRIAERPLDFENLLFAQIRDAAEAAAARVDAHDVAVRLSEDYSKAIKEVLGGLARRRSQEAKLLRDSLKKFSDRVFAAQDELNKLAQEIEKNVGLGGKWNLQQWLDEIEGRMHGVRPGRVTDLDRQFYNDYDALVKKLDSAKADYGLFVSKNKDRIEVLSKKPVPDALSGRPKRPATYERDRLLAYGDGFDNPGLAGKPELIRERAREITAKLLSGTDPHIQMEYGLRASLKAREIDLNPAVFEPFFKDSFIQNVESYASVVSREVAAMEKFGTVKSEDVIARLNDDYMKALENAKTDAEREALRQRFEVESDLIKDLMAEARGTRNQAKSKAQQKAREIARGVATFNYVAYMGSGLLAQIGDITRAVMAYGLLPFVKHSLKSFAAGVTGVFQKVPKENLTKLATAMEWANLGRERALYEIAPPEHQGRFARGMTQLGNFASRVSLMPLWNDWLRISGVRVTDDILVRGLEDLRAGRQPSDEFRIIVSKSGIGAEMLERIGRQIQEYKDTIPAAKDYGSPLFDSNMEAWFSRDYEAFEAYRLLLHTGAREALIQPGTLDSPMWTQNAFSGLLLQFKRFVITSVPQIMLPFLQRSAADKLVIGITALAAGATATVLRDLNTKGAIQDREVVGWVLDSLDMSGLVSGLTEFDATVSALAGGRGIKRMLTGEDYSRWKEREQTEGLFGPTYRTFKYFREAMWLPYNALHPDEKIAERQITALRRIIPLAGTNLLLRHPADMIEASLGGRQDTAGAKLMRAVTE